MHLAARSPQRCGLFCGCRAVALSRRSRKGRSTCVSYVLQGVLAQRYVHPYLNRVRNLGMSYQPILPERPAPGEPYSPEPASHPDASVESGQHHFAALIPATTEQDEDILLSIKQVFDREQVTLQSPHDYAADALREYLAQHGIEDDPDDLVLATLYLEFADVDEGPWRAQVAHAMTLTQALIANWQQQGSGSWTDHLGRPMAWRRQAYEVSEIVELSPAQLANSVAYDAIYQRDPAQTYGAATQVNLDPATFRAFVWETGLQSRYLEYLRHFWSHQQHTYHLLLKGSVVHAALLQRDEGTLSRAHAELVLKSLMLSPDTSWEGTSFRYFADNPVSRTRTISPLKIHGYEASDIMVFGEHGQDHQVLYIPGNSSPLHGFANVRELRDWFTHQCRNPRKRAALASHFSSKDRQDGNFFSGVDVALAGLAAHPRRLNDATGHWYPSSTITIGGARYPYPLSYFRDRIKQRLFSDADYDIGSKSQYYRKLTAYGVEISANVVGAIALAVPALAPLAAALGVALLGVGAGEMLTAHNREEQAEGAQRLVFGFLNALPLAGELSQLKAFGATLDETQRAVAEAAEAEHATQVLQDAAVEGAQGPALEATAEYKAARPVHDTLQPDLRNNLKRLATDRPLRVAGSGKGVFIDQGKMYVRVRPDVYRVQWLEHEQQLRIRSEDEPLQWGPFLTCMDNGYWDIDLRYGLRGGTGGVKVIERPPLPAEEIEGIECQPLIPKVEVSFATDGLFWSHEKDCYEADIVFTHDDHGETLDRKEVARDAVWYDADSAAWRRRGKYLWRVKSGKAYRWKQLSAQDYERVRHTLVQDESIAEYRFPDLPQLPANATPIPNEIHMIWVGEKELGYMIKRTISKNLRVKGYKFIMHLDNDAAALEANRAWCNEVGIEARDLREQPYFQRFIAGREGVAYNYFRSPTASSRNYAAASDYLRLRIIDELGGIYMDIDDSLMVSEARPLPAGANDVLLGGEYKMPWHLQKRIATSHFASHRNNPVLKRLLQGANERFEQLPESFKSTPRPQVSDFKSQAEGDLKMNAYMQTISNLAGPDAFNQGLKTLRPDYMGLMDIDPDESWVQSRIYEDFYHEAMVHWFPLRMDGVLGIQPGSAHTWLTT
ncbi:dermonecrotic toxin domain-containing protein [Pseudomonas sp. NPDC089401]|uniref:dermonecrotic toxin domain-containing protein n=1 Tax=Pseudomonas sp. NPDC089401 TaxID=3364462 RepID=UPI00381E3FAA